MVPPRAAPPVPTVLRSAAASLARFRMPWQVREELVQEATLRTLAARDVRDADRFVRGVGRRLGIDWMRQSVRERCVEVEEAPERSPWEDRVQSDLDYHRARVALEGAPPSYRRTLVALYVEERTVEEVVTELAGAAGSTEDRRRAKNLVYQRRIRALRWLRTRLEAP